MAEGVNNSFGLLHPPKGYCKDGLGTLFWLAPQTSPVFRTMGLRKGRNIK